MPPRSEVFQRKWGSPGDGDGQFNVLISLAVRDDEVYVTDSGNYRVQVFDPQRQVPAQMGLFR
jgi:hypothetical protein